MASATPVREIKEETKCPICQEYLMDPVTIRCGHNFCRGCITQFCETWEEGDYDPLCCPSCRARIPKGSFRNNYQLANIVEKIKQLHFKREKENLCEVHSKALDLFCEEDGEAVCVVCWRSPEHRSHTVLLIEEAAQKYKEKIQAHLKTLREQKEKLLESQMTGEGKSQYLIEKKRQEIVADFQQLHQFLEEEERLLLAQLEKLEKEIPKIQDENVTKVSEEISHLSELISELEEKCQEPASEFLQDIRSTLSRCEKGKFQQPEEISPELEKRLSDLSQKTLALMEPLRKFKDTLPSALERKRGEPLGAHGLFEFAANVTLDPDTAHSQLILSEDQKRVRRGDIWQRLPNNPERFDTDPCVLGCEGFTSGRHCWEVEVRGVEFWAVGVARESLRRKGRIRHSPKEGIWAMERWGQFRALTSPATPLPLSRAPSRIRVCLDCDRGQVTFIDAGDEAPIFTFPPGSVPGERIRPWFRVWPGSRLRLCP